MQAGSSRSEASDPRDKVAELVTKDVWDRLIFDEASGELDSSERAADATAAGLAVDAEEKRSPQSPPQPLSPLSPPRGVDALQSGGLESALGADPRKRNRAAASMSSVASDDMRILTIATDEITSIFTSMELSQLFQPGALSSAPGSASNSRTEPGE
ncbi:hypothetical protein EMIHUDRAFT_459592 [Emiliania huxleyi CCMP1516]|uniref:Uncharacterized protein n=2 Tax=Emiliania huxleyi TaxID=2903 RepID=A0A0D3IFC6_EMIH1|nr:hypothetical protein EMIHUDRAFT_452753 [Emiliania huxleyi CCMP1516]XP_005765649.1 hypothetical protein EMIHUDRAFT_459592 [Emiliania huxleyi CCMP1516]EOD09961.1 hypothetical protein EMIHUDRAFT_452753 [Emiliania huxleyi CCMP1516]EOD13220.1 hypothetical protein EMIHUDRAFT_459592 [Emiliania huxleyi CCMP1516]|eukprot:XP_005762390.1 hypothetical protein EMIHUDRAFT_452753 [Emiliania huxleyi CCMP1516]